MKKLIRKIVCLAAFLGIVYSQMEDVFIRSISLDGNEHVNINEVLLIVRQHPPNWLFRRPDFDPRLLKLDALTLKSYYHSKGFLDVVVEESSTINEDYADIFYKITEGKQYFVSEVEVVGQKTVSPEKIKTLLGLIEKKPYNPVRINDNLYLVENEYHEIGKLFFNINIQDVVTDSVKVIIQVAEGKKIYVNKTYLKDMGLIDSSLVLRELTYKPESLYRKSTMDKTEKRLREMGVFSMANIIPIQMADSDSLVNIVIEFRRFKQREWNSTGGYDPIRFAEGAEPLPALSGTIEWKNRSLFNYPTHLSTKLLAGVPVEEELILPRIRYDVSIGSNWILGVRFPTSLTGYYETFIDYYTEELETINRYGVNLSQMIRFGNRSYFETKSVWESFSDQSDQNLQQRSIAFKINLENKDDPLYTRKGYLISILLKSAGYVLGGERDYLKGDLTFQSYVPIGKKSVFALRVKTGILRGWTYGDVDYSYEKFYLGGSTSMRGWDVLRFRESKGKPAGEVIRLMTNLEFRFPVYKSLGLTLFTDGGLLEDQIKNISSNELEWDAGLGLALQTPLGPARLDYAVQIDDPSTGKIQLGVQYLF
ncbi:MAG: BamA/TamA family outer membrane protein [Candidatus Neomarinimicrobiota bacterium]|nr:BamA/TamA family outer membrane protein [Candidatus Neomarinimicrobiota bacterium]